MAQSLAAQHRARVEGGAALASTSPVKPQLTANQRLMWAALEADKSRLQLIRSRRRKADVKRELLPKYADHLTAIINSSDTRHSESLVTLCVWAFDAGDWHTALMLADYAVRHGMQSPQGFKRSLPETLLEEAAKLAVNQGCPSHVRDHLQHLHMLTSGVDIADEVTAKFNKVLGRVLEPVDPAAALLAYQTAQQYGAQVKRSINKLNKGVKR